MGYSVRHSGYTNEHEIKFIDAMGISNNVNWLKLDRKMTRKKLLEGYLAALKYRNEWANIDKDLIIQYLRLAIKECK